MTSAATNLVLYGTDEILAEPLELRAGPLEMSLQRGKLLNIRVGDVEVWHGIAFVYRDVDWGTPEPVIERCESTVSADAFRVTIAGYFPTVRAALPFLVRIEGGNDGSIRFLAESVPAADIETNRFGICLMHPMSAGGARVNIKHVDGRESRSTLPTLIPSWPPFMLIRAIHHEYAPNQWAQCDFEGDLFELEDQRNNSDASFKTYNRSNLMPRPYWLRVGVAIKQSAHLRLELPWTRRSARGPSPVTVSVGGEVRDLPSIGIEIVRSDVGAGEPVRAALRALRPSHLHLGLQNDGAAVNWGGVADMLGVSGAQLRLDLTVGDIAAVTAVVDALGAQLSANGIVPESIAVFPSEQPCIDAVRHRFPDTRVGGGTPHFFVQLHRAERVGAVDFLTFTTSPIVHGTLESEVMLTLQSLPSMIETLRERYAMAIRIGPSTIAARSSPLGNQPPSDGTRRLALARQDPRCRGLFGAAWSLGYVAQFAMAGVESISLMSLTGDSGIVKLDGDALIRYPTYFLLTRLCEPARLRQVTVSDPARVAALALSRGDRKELLVGNLTGHDVDVDVDVSVSSGSVAIMDAESWASFRLLADPWETMRQRAASPRHRLGPYAVMSFCWGT